MRKRVLISESDVPGLPVEAAMLEGFIALAEPLAARRLADNLRLTAETPPIRSAVFSLDA